ncbi:MAG: hypothetical protein V1839_02100 [archaeon]
MMTLSTFNPPEHMFAVMSIIALVLLVISFILALKLRNMMGAGKDTAPVKILMITILLNALFGVYSASSMFWKYQHDYLTHVRVTDVFLLAIGIILVTYIYKVYRDYTRLLKKNEPNR